ncbi:MAG: hypothetical protein QOH47_2382 [Sphingomonadales bacterium]|jgi:hypothetical protein|nr:hypothetical protein [Sphingomonadales bacterium]
MIARLLTAPDGNPTWLSTALAGLTVCFGAAAALWMQF